VPDQKPVDKFLPPYLPRFQLDTANPGAFNQFVAPHAYMEMRYNIQIAMEQVPENYARIAEEFEIIFGRQHNPAEAVRCEDAGRNHFRNCRDNGQHLSPGGKSSALTG
jgi:pyruvate ferredoxin oxidoreductase alpha subunit